MEKASVLVKDTKDVREIKSIFLQVPEVRTRRGDRNPDPFIFSFTKRLYFSPKNYQILFLFIKPAVTLHFPTVSLLLFLPLKHIQG